MTDTTFIAKQHPPRVLGATTALVTGANGGIGVAFVQALLDQGAARVYAAMRDPASLPQQWQGDSRVVPVKLDVTNRADIAEAAARYRDIDLFICNAAVTCIGPVSEKDETTVRHVMEVNYFGPVMLTQALSDALRSRRGGIIYVLSMAAMIPPGPAPVYSASKAACAMYAAGVRSELGKQGVQVTLCFPGYVDTRQSAAFKSRKASPESIANETLRAWTEKQSHVFPDAFSQLVLAEMARDGATMLTDPEGARKELARKHEEQSTMAELAAPEGSAQS